MTLANLETITDLQSWCKTWPLNGSKRTRAKEKLPRKHKRSLQKFLEPDRKPKLIETDNSLEFGKACEDLSWNHCTSTPSRFGEPLKGPIIPFGSLVEYHPKTAKDQSRIHQFGKKVSPGLLLGYALYAVGFWKGDIMVAHIEELETMDASEIYLKKTQCKGSNISQRKWKIRFSSRRWTNQICWRRSGTENTHLDTKSPNSRRKSP